ncbi:hypothetical protein LCGC14_2689100, partial [marine sediment metagenome]
SKREECGFIAQIKNAYMCNQCDTMYDKHKMANWNWSNTGYGNCPVGEEIPEETPKEYQERLWSLILEYQEDFLGECISQKHYLEAIGTLSIQIYEQLRFLITKKIKGLGSIPLDRRNRRYNVTLEVIKAMKDYQLCRYSLIYDLISESEFEDLEKFREMRNDFTHSFDRRDNHTEQEIIEQMDKIKVIERRISEIVKRYNILDNLS